MKCFRRRVEQRERHAAPAGAGAGGPAAPPVASNRSCYTKREFWSSRSPTGSAIAQTARHPSVDITDTTPAHTAAALRPDRHHTHGLHTTISGWRLYEAYGEQSFVAISSCPGRPMNENNSLRHAACMPPCRKLSGVAWQGPQQEEFATKAHAVVCATRRHQRLKAVERPARARDVWRRGLHG